MAGRRWRAMLLGGALTAAGLAVTAEPAAAEVLFPVPSVELDLGAQDLAWDRTRDLVYASVGGQGAEPNTIAVIEPSTGEVLRHVPTGAEPRRIELSDDDTRLYVALLTSRTVAEYALPDLTLVRQFGLGAQLGVPNHAADIAVLPGRPESIAVALSQDGSSPSAAGVAIFDAGVPRAVTVDRFARIAEIEAAADGTFLYGQTADGFSNFVRMVVDPTGVAVLDSRVAVSGRGMRYGGGRIYALDGLVTDPATFLTYGALVHPPDVDPRAMVPDAGANTGWKVVERTATLDEELWAYDLTTLTKIDAFAMPRVPSADRSPGKLVHGEPGRLAFLDGGRVVLLAPWLRRGSAGEYTPLTPARILDTRTGTGTAGAVAPLGAGSAIDVQVAGAGGVPTTGVTAVVLNATVTDPTGGGFLTVWPAGDARPLISNLNFVAGQTVANLVTIGLGEQGRVAVYNLAGTSHVVFDVVGFYADPEGPAGSRFHPLAPARLFDTRVTARPLGPGASLPVTVTGLGGVPASGVRAIAMNVTVTGTASAGYLTVFPGDVERPLASNINFGPGDTVPNLVIVRVPPSGIVEFFNSGTRAHVLADVVGYFDDDRGTQHGRLVPLAPFRTVDTREASPYPPPGKLGPTDVLLLGSGAETAIGAYVLNVTVTEPTAPGYVTVYPYPGSPPLASHVNFTAGRTVPNAVLVRTGPQLAFYNSAGSSHLIVDVFGVFT